MDQTAFPQRAGRARHRRRRVVALLACTLGVMLAGPASGALAASISGTVLDDGGDPEDFSCINVYEATTPGFPVALGFTDASGDYAVTELPAGSYRVAFIPCSSPGLASEYYDDKRDFASADVIALTAAQSRTGVDAQLEPESTIAGTVRDGSGAPLAGVCVRLYDDGISYPSLESGITEADGSYSFSGLAATGYKLEFDPDCFGATPLLGEYHQNRTTFASADAVVLGAAEDRTVDAQLGDGASVSGTVTDPEGAPIADACVTVTSSSFNITAATTDATGSYTAAGLVAGDYKVSFSDCGAGGYVTEWWDDAPDSSSATVVGLDPDEDVTGIDAELAIAEDTTGPTLSISGGPTGPTNDPTPTFGFDAEAGSTVVCSIDSGTEAYGACSGPGGAHTPAALGDGDYTFRVKATDGAGNPTVRTREFSVDTVGPSVDINGGPTGPTNDTTPTFTFNPELGSTLQCSVDTGTSSFGSCSGPGLAHTPASLADGPWTFRVRATDAVGNENMATRSFTVDTVPPSLSITGGPTGPTSDPRPTFNFSAGSGSTVACSIDTGTAAFGPCSGTGAHQPASALDDGPYTFRVRATDAAGNQASTTRPFSVDTGAPDTTITSGPSGTISTNSATFTFSSDTTGASYQCKLDAGSFASCTSPFVLSGLADGPHAFSVRSTDPAGNVEPTPATRFFSVAVPPPPPPPTGDPACDEAREDLEAAQKKYDNARAKFKKAKGQQAKKKAKAVMKKAKKALQEAKAAVAAECG